MENKTSQADKIYEYLKSGGRLSSWNSRDLFHTVCLPRRISDIEDKHGIKVGREWKKSENTRYLEYFINELKLF